MQIIRSFNIRRVSIRAKEKSETVISSVNGEFFIRIENLSGKLVFSYLSYQTVEFVIPKSLKMTVELQAVDKQLDEVVVTVLGIERSERFLGYSVGVLDNEQLNRINNENFLNTMAAKTPTVSISSTGGPGSSVHVVI